MSNNWHPSMYDETYAKLTLNSKDRLRMARKETNFILSKLNLNKGGSIIDIPCGTGRHSYLFAKKGYKVTGLDISTACLKIAKANCSHPNICYEKANMKDLKKYYGQYNLALNLFSSFGYFQTDLENKNILKEFYRSLKNSGVLVLNTINRDWLLRVYNPLRWEKNGENYFLTNNSYDAKTHYNQSELTIINTTENIKKSYYHRMRLYSKNEMVKLLKSTGFKNVKVFGGSDGSNFKKNESSHPFYFASK